MNFLTSVKRANCLTLESVKGWHVFFVKALSSALLFRWVAATTEMTYLVGQLDSWMAYGAFWQITIMISNVFSQISHNLGKRSLT